MQAIGSLEATTPARASRALSFSNNDALQQHRRTFCSETLFIYRRTQHQHQEQHHHVNNSARVRTRRGSGTARVAAVR